MATKDPRAKKSRVVRDNASMQQVVFLRPGANPPPAHPLLWFTHGRSLVFMLLTILVISTLAFTVRGSSFDYYPETCLGSWKNPENAQGRPTLQFASANVKTFNQSNSAVFFGGTQSIICQSFSGQLIPADSTLSRVTVALSLVVKHPAPVAETPVVPVLEPTDQASTSASSTPGEAEFTIIDETASSSDSTETPPAEEPPAEPVPAPEPVPEPAPESTPEPTPDTTPAPSDAPADSAPSSDSSSGSGSSEPSAFFSPFVKRAYAQEQIASDILGTVSYSFDGVDWQALGTVTATNYRDLAFQIPVGAGGLSSVADLPNLRVRIDAESFSVDNPLEIYLDGVTVEVSIDEFIAPEEPLPLDEIAVMDENSLPMQALKQSFSLARTVIPTDEVLPWQPLDYQIENADEDGKDITRSVATIDAHTEELVVSGSCKQDYFTVLVFRTANAYAVAPRTALFNSAYPCTNGLYSYSLSPDSLHLAAGTYYLLVADQPQDGPWVPISAIMPFTISDLLIQ